MSLCIATYVIGMLLWVFGVLLLSKGADPIYKWVFAGLLGVIWPISVYAVLYYIYSERNDNNA